MIENQEKSKKPEWEGEIKDFLVRYLEDLNMWMDLFDRLDFSPSIFTQGMDERSWPELNDEERETILKVVFSEIGFNPDNAKPIRKYEFKAPENATWSGTARVEVYSTKNSPYTLHKINRKGTEKEYFLAEEDYEL